MATTIQIENNIKGILDKMKLFDRDTYNNIIERMIEDNLEFNEQTKKDIEEAKKHIKTGKVISHEEVKKRFGV